MAKFPLWKKPSHYIIDVDNFELRGVQSLEYGDNKVVRK